MKKQGRLKIGVFILILAVLFLILNLTGWFKPIKNFFYSFSESGQENLSETGGEFFSFWNGFWNSGEIKKDLEKAKAENQELLAEIADLKELENENKSLKEALGIKLEKEFDLASAKVIGKDVFRDSISVNLGERDGVSSDMAVITGEKVLVGRVGEVYSDYSEVVLISDKRSFFDAKVAGKDIYGIVEGRGGSDFFFNKILKEKDVSEGDLVITTSLSGLFPDGLFVGEVSEVKKPDVEAFQNAEIRRTIDFHGLNNVFIILND